MVMKKLKINERLTIKTYAIWNLKIAYYLLVPENSIIYKSVSNCYFNGDL